MEQELIQFREWQVNNWNNIYLYSNELMVTEYLKYVQLKHIRKASNTPYYN